jgi:quinol monooxygenase YgiN
MTTPSDDRPELLTVIAYMRAADGRADELREALLALIAPTAAERGYVNYDPHESVTEPGVFFFYENWDSADDLDAHLAAPHLVEFAARIPELLDDDGLTITRLKRLA